MPKEKSSKIKRMLLEWHKKPEENIKNSFQIIVSVLLSVSLASFLMMILQNIPDNSKFIFNILFITTLYVIIIYLFTFYELEHNHYLIPRTIIIILFSALPYLAMRVFVKIGEINQLDISYFKTYFFILALFGVAWAIWEGISKKEKIRFDARLIIFLVLSAIAGYYKWGGGF